MQKHLSILLAINLLFPILFGSTIIPTQVENKSPLLSSPENEVKSLMQVLFYDEYTDLYENCSTSEEKKLQFETDYQEFVSSHLVGPNRIQAFSDFARSAHWFNDKLKKILLLRLLTESFHQKEASLPDLLDCISTIYFWKDGLPIRNYEDFITISADGILLKDGLNNGNTFKFVSVLKSSLQIEIFQKFVDVFEREPKAEANEKTSASLFTQCIHEEIAPKAMEVLLKSSLSIEQDLIRWGLIELLQLDQEESSFTLASLRLDISQSPLDPHLSRLLAKKALSMRSLHQFVPPSFVAPETYLSSGKFNHIQLYWLIVRNDARVVEAILKEFVRTAHFLKHPEDKFYPDAPQFTAVLTQIKGMLYEAHLDISMFSRLIQYIQSLQNTSEKKKSKSQRRSEQIPNSNPFNEDLIAFLEF